MWDAVGLMLVGRDREQNRELSIRLRTIDARRKTHAVTHRNADIRFDFKMVYLFVSPISRHCWLLFSRQTGPLPPTPTPTEQRQ
jgi:hypothetical protein